MYVMDSLHFTYMYTL